jgi:hypothetical protein
LSSGLPLAVDHMANLHGAVSGMLGRSPFVLPVTIAASAATMMFAVRLRPQAEDALLIAIPVSALVSYYLFIHDMCILLIPMVLTLDRLMGAEKGRYRLEGAKMSTAALLFAAPACMSFTPDQFWLVSLPLLAFTLAICVRH